MRFFYSVLALFLVCGVAYPQAPAEEDDSVSTPPGLYVKDGVLMRHGAPYRGIGANFFDLFARRLYDPTSESYRTRLKELSEAGIPFVRFMACGFWPVNWDLYFRDREAWFALMDEVVEGAEEANVGLIPSLFWHYGTVADIVGEHIDQYGNPESKSCAFIRDYTREMALRYKDSPAIWGWEFGNEYNLPADLPNHQRPPVAPRLGTPKERMARDELKMEDLLVAFGEFAKTVHQYDPDRIILAGNSIPRPSAYHSWKEGTWEKDAAGQSREMLLRLNPDPFDVISVHVYPRESGAYTAGAKTAADLIAVLQGFAEQAGKPLFVGEYGAPATLPPEEERAKFEQLTNAIVRNGVSLAAFWVFDLPRQEGEWSVRPDNDRAYMLDIVGKANARMVEEETVNSEQATNPVGSR